MKMKKFFAIIMSVAVVLAIIVSSACAGGGGGGSNGSINNTANGEVAASILAKGIERWEGNYSFDIDGQSYNCYYQMTKDGLTNYLTVNEVVIVGENDAPISGIILDETKPAQNFYLWTMGRDRNGIQRVSGQFSKPTLFLEDAINIQLELADVRKIVEFALPNGVNPREVVLDAGQGWLQSYAEYYQGFDLWLKPDQTYSYRIFNATTDAVYATGTINLSAKTDQTYPRNRAVNILNPGNVKIVGSNYAWLIGQKLNGQVERNGQTISAKVYLWEIANKTGSVNVYGMNQGKIEIFAISPSDNLVPIVQKDIVWGEASWINQGYEKLIVTITGDLLEPEIGFTMDFSTQ